MLMLLQHATDAVQHAEESSAAPNLLSPNGGLMVWTLLIFIALWVILAKFAFKPITKAVEDREKALQDALDAAQRDREAATALLAEQRAGIATARDEAQKIIADARTISEQMRGKLLDETRAEQQVMLERARGEIAAERDRAIDELRREAVDLAIAGASKVIGKNLDDASNRAIIDNFLKSIPSDAAKSAVNG
jgi:F-type H+-transporting ATPase subunit b